MAINAIIQDTTCGFLPDILLFTQALIFVWWLDCTIIVDIISTLLLLTIYVLQYLCLVMIGGSACCVCVFSSHPFWTSSSLDVPAGVTQEEGHTGFLIHLPSAVRALIFVARRIQPFLSLVDREVEFCVLTN